jgi:hypothetical protein
MVGSSDGGPQVAVRGSTQWWEGAGSKCETTGSGGRDRQCNQSIYDIQWGPVSDPFGGTIFRPEPNLASWINTLIPLNPIHDSLNC